MGKWLLLVYKLPRDPSAPRVALWRALQRIDGGGAVGDGVFAVPDSAIARQELDNLAHDVRNDGGQASLLSATSLDDDRYLVALQRSEPPTAKAKKTRAKSTR